MYIPWNMAQFLAKIWAYGHRQLVYSVKVHHNFVIVKAFVCCYNYFRDRVKKTASGFITVKHRGKTVRVNQKQFAAMSTSPSSEND
jgi:hypothetical protein